MFKTFNILVKLCSEPGFILFFVALAFYLGGGIFFKKKAWPSWIPLLPLALIAVCNIAFLALMNSKSSRYGLMILPAVWAATAWGLFGVQWDRTAIAKRYFWKKIFFILLAILSGVYVFISIVKTTRSNRNKTLFFTYLKNNFRTIFQDMNNPLWIVLGDDRILVQYYTHTDVTTVPIYYPYASPIHQYQKALNGEKRDIILICKEKTQQEDIAIFRKFNSDYRLIKSISYAGKTIFCFQYIPPFPIQTASPDPDAVEIADIHSEPASCTAAEDWQRKLCIASPPNPKWDDYLAPFSAAADFSRECWLHKKSGKPVLLRTVKNIEPRMDYEVELELFSPEKAAFSVGYPGYYYGYCAIGSSTSKNTFKWKCRLLDFPVANIYLNCDEGEFFLRRIIVRQLPKTSEENKK